MKSHNLRISLKYWVLFYAIASSFQSQASIGNRIGVKSYKQRFACLNLLNLGTSQSSDTASPSAQAFLRLIQRSLIVLPGAQKDIETLLRSPQPKSPYAHRSELAAAQISQALHHVLKKLSGKDWLIIQNQLSIILDNDTSNTEIRKNNIAQTEKVYAPMQIFETLGKNQSFHFVGDYLFVLPNAYEKSISSDRSPIIVDLRNNEAINYSSFLDFADEDVYGMNGGKAIDAHPKIDYKLAETEDAIYVFIISRSVLGISKFDKVTKSFSRIAVNKSWRELVKNYFAADGKYYFAPDSGNFYMVFDTKNPEIGISIVVLTNHYNQIDIFPEGIFLFTKFGKNKGLNILNTRTGLIELIPGDHPAMTPSGLITRQVADGKVYGFSPEIDPENLLDSYVKVDIFDLKSLRSSVRQILLPRENRFQFLPARSRVMNGIVESPFIREASKKTNSVISLQSSQLYDLTTSQVLATDVPYIQHLFAASTRSVVFNNHQSGIYVGELDADYTHPYVNKSVEGLPVKVKDDPTQRMIYYPNIRAPENAIVVHQPLDKISELNLTTENLDPIFRVHTMSNPQFAEFENRLYAVFEPFDQRKSFMTDTLIVTIFDIKTREFQRLHLPDELDADRTGISKISFETDSKSQNLYLVVKSLTKTRVFSLFKTVTRVANNEN